MALLGSMSVAAWEGKQAHAAVPRSDFWRSGGGGSSGRTRRVLLPVSLRPSIETGHRSRVAKRVAITCAIQMNRASMEDAPKSPGKVAPAEALRSTNKGWSDEMDVQNQFLVKQLRDLATVASDRSEMHHILSVQRDDWNSLFHTTITMASVSAAVAAALNGAEHALGLSVMASFLGLGAAVLMALVSFFQPSQLAEEQRTAARFFKRLAADIRSTLETDPRLRQEASHYSQQKLATLHALDCAFPLPLTPIVLEKFPKVVSPSILSGPPAPKTPQLLLTSASQSVNGWTSAIEQDLKRTSRILRTSDIPAYIEMATQVNHLNKALAIASTVLTTSGALLNTVDAVSGMRLSVLGAALTVAAFFVHSLSHAVQLGAAYEIYRNCAGYYADLERSIETALRRPVEQREFGVTFLEKIALQLGRSPADSPIVPLDQEKAGTLF